MKKIIIPFALSILSITAYSQSWMKGGNNPSANPFTLGSNTNDPISFETNNINRITITSAGLVSISNGLSAPLSLLHVNSNGNTINGALFSTTCPSTANNFWRMLTGNNNGTEKFRLFVPQNTENVFLRSSTNNGTMAQGKRF